MPSLIGARVSRFDHAVIAVRDLDAAVQTYRNLGFVCIPGGRHSGRGTENAIIRFGLDYVELISVHDERLGRSVGGNALDLINYLDAHSGGGLGFALAAEHLDALAAAWSPDLPPVSGPFPMERVRSDGKRLSWRLLVPGGSAWRRPWPFFIEWETPDDERVAMDGPAQHPNGASSVAGVGVLVRDVREALILYVRELGLTVEQRWVAEPAARARRTRLILDDFYIDLLEPTGPGPALSALEREGEGLFQVDMTVSDLGLPMARSAAVATDDRGALVSPTASCGIRLLFRLPRHGPR